MTPGQAQELDSFFALRTPEEIQRIQIVAGARARVVIREHLLEQLARGFPERERERMRQHGRTCRLEINGVEVRHGGPGFPVDELMIYLEPVVSMTVRDPDPDWKY